MRHSIFLPLGFGHEFAGVEPAAAFEALTTLAVAGDELGFDTAYVIDHIETIPPSADPLFECWTTVAALLRATGRMRIGQLVTANGYRNPVLQAKMAATADAIGDGRFTFGIGAGWYEPDYVTLGLPFGDAPSRLRALRETLPVIRERLPERVPVLIAGGGEKVTLRLVAEFGYACNVLESPEALARKFAILRSHCERVGRDFDAIRRTSASVCIFGETDEEARAALPPGSEFAFPGDLAGYGLIGTSETIRRRLAAYEAAGVQELAISFGGPDPIATLRRYAEEIMSTSPASSSRRGGTALPA
jgi:alkanesulfonate monooxygenase SsuD/methylene tetrahydromethanopterin reductase-like flavin-dependent oxidoreductase (luciferase family)